MPSRMRYPKKDVERAFRLAEEHGWTVTQTSRGHRWGSMHCGFSGPEPCMFPVWSTPRNPGDHANDLRRHVRNCAHQVHMGNGDDS